EVHVPDPQDRTTFLRSKLGSGIGASSSGNDAIRRWVAELMALRPRVIPRDAWATHPAGVTESAPRVLTMHGPITVHANLTDAPVMVHGGALLATFGAVTDAGDGTLQLGPDAVALIDPEG